MGGRLVYGAAANCFSSQPKVAAPSRQGKSCQPSFYLVPRVCALKKARSAPGGRRTKPQPPPPLPPSAVSLEGLKPGRGGRAAERCSGSWEEIWWLARGAAYEWPDLRPPWKAERAPALAAPAALDRSTPFLLPEGCSLTGKRGSFTACLIPCRTEMPSASVLALALRKEAFSHLPLSLKRFGEDSQPRVSYWKFQSKPPEQVCKNSRSFFVPLFPSPQVVLQRVWDPAALPGSSRSLGRKCAVKRFIKNTYTDSIDGREEEAGGQGCESGRGGSFGVYSSEDAALTQTPSLPPALGPTTGRDGAPAPPAQAAPPGLRIAPSASPRCRRPSSAALLPSSRPPCPAPAAVWCRGRAQTPEPFCVLQNGLWGLGGRVLHSRPVSKMAAVWLRLGNPAPVRRGG